MVGQARPTAIARWARRGADRLPTCADPTALNTSSTPAQATYARRCSNSPMGAVADLALDTRGGRAVRIHSSQPTVRGPDGRDLQTPNHGSSSDLSEIYSRQLHVTGMASVFMDGAHAARHLRPTQCAVRTAASSSPRPWKAWQLENSAEAYQTVLDGSGRNQAGPVADRRRGRRKGHDERRPRTSTRHHASPTAVRKRPDQGAPWAHARGAIAGHEPGDIERADHARRGHPGRQSWPGGWRPRS